MVAVSVNSGGSRVVLGVGVQKEDQALLIAAKEALNALNQANILLGGGRTTRNERTGKESLPTQEYFLSARKALKAAINKTKARSQK